MHKPQLILASRSPRRRELLEQIGISYRTAVPDIDESSQPDETPEALVQRLAQEKAIAIWQQSDQHLPVLGADTLGVLQGKLLVKPQHYAHARTMLQAMSGQQHTILSAVTLCAHNGVHTRLNRSFVKFRIIQEAEIAAYWASGEPQNKAGAYAIQGYGALFAERIEGSYSAIMGLPLFETAQLLMAAGIHPLTRTAQ